MVLLLVYRFAAVCGGDPGDSSFFSRAQEMTLQVWSGGKQAGCTDIKDDPARFAMQRKQRRRRTMNIL